MSALTVRIRASSAPLLVTIAGELDWVSAPQLRHALRALPVADLVLEVSGVRFLDAAGLTLLLELRARVQAAGARMVLAAAPRAVQRVIDIAGLDRALPTSRTVDEAVALLTRVHGCHNGGSRRARTGPDRSPRQGMT